MLLQDQINSDWKSALLNRDEALKKVLSYTKAKLQEKAKNSKLEKLSDNDSMFLIKKLIKEQEDLLVHIANEEAKNHALYEIDVLKKYLPAQLAKEELVDFLKTEILNTNATSKDIGKLIKATINKYGNGVDGKTIKELLNEMNLS